jgi:hypothetical protein
MRLLALSLATILCPASMLGQVLYGSLVGSVTDPSGGAVPKARVEALNTSTGVGRQTATDDRGAFSFNDLQAGQYKVTISAPSFNTVNQENLAIAINTVQRLDIRLQVASVTETVTVSTAAITLQSDRSDVNNQITRTQVMNLPFSGQQGRNFQNLYKLIPGFSPPAELHSDAGNPQRSLGTNVNGASYSNNNTRLDGATISYPWLPHITAYVPPAEAIETVNIVSNSFDAEQGMAGGSAINVSIKSGTNELHGSGHWYHTNSKVQARNFFFTAPRLPKNLLNQFGGTIGGPIVKNKLFFFADWERTTRRRFASAFRTVPQAELRQGDFSATGTAIFDPLTGTTSGATAGAGRVQFPGNRIPASRFDPASVIMTGLIPAANQLVFPSNYLALGTYSFNRDNSDFKVNYNPNERTSLFTRYSFSPSEIFDPPSLGPALGDALAGGQPGKAPGRIQTASVGGTYTISPRILFDGNIGFTRQRLSAENIDLDKNYGLDTLKIPGTNGPDRLQGGYPRFNISGFSAIGNPNVSNPFLFRDHQYVVTGNLSWMKGAHSIRFGGEYTYYTINHFQPQAAFGPRGGFNFTGGLTALRGGVAPNAYNGFADFLLGAPNAFGKDVQYINPSAVRMPAWGIYIRDQWQVNRKLTLNYGTRFERYPYAYRDHRGAERYDVDLDRVLIGGLGNVPKDQGVDVGLGQFAPRFGIAWRANDRMVLRLGYGISVDPDSFRRLRDNYPATVSTTFNAPSTLEAAGTLRTGIPAIVVPALDSGIIALPSAVNTNTVPTKFNRGYIQSFNATVQRDIGLGFNLQAGYVGTRAIRQTALVNINPSLPGTGNNGRTLNLRHPGRLGNITLYTPFNTSNYNSLQTQLRKRMAGSGMFGVSYTWSKAITFADNNDSGLTWNSPEFWGRNRAPASFDRPHNLQIYGVYELPFGKGKTYATSGAYAWILGGWQTNGLMSIMSGTPFTVSAAGTSLNAQANGQTADQVKANVTKGKRVGPGQSWFDPEAFAPVTAVRFGTSGRNAMRGPNSFQLDASLFRNFEITERWKLQFRAESFSITNTPRFGNPGANASNLVRNADGSIRSLGGYTEVLGAGGEREIRFALKVFF